MLLTRLLASLAFACRYAGDAVPLCSILEQSLVLAVASMKEKNWEERKEKESATVILSSSFMRNLSYPPPSGLELLQRLCYINKL